MSVTRWDVTPRNASLGLQRLYSGLQLHNDGGAHAPRDERPIAAQPSELHAAWKELSRDERRLAEKIETARKRAEMADGSLLCYCDGGADGNGANGVCGAVGWGTSMLRKIHVLRMCGVRVSA